MDNVPSTEIIDMELLNAKEILEEYGEEEAHTEYSEVSTMTENIQDETVSLVKEQKIPERNIISEVSTSELAIDLAMANLAKQTAVKLQKLEGFLGKIEDKLFNEKILDDMNKGDLLLLYTNTRMMRGDSFRMLREIRKEVDFASLEANLLSLHAKESVKNAGDDAGDRMNSILEQLFTDDSFIKNAEKNLRVDMNKSEPTENKDGS